MKNIKKPLFGILLLFLAFTSCEYDGIDPITAVDPGADSGVGPDISIIRPINGFEIQVPEAVTSVDIEIKVVDDIEVELITVSLDGVEIATYDDFLDYRVVNRKLTYDQITTGDHVLTVEAKDLAGNVTTKIVNFTKSPPYTPLFNGEMFYMNFDGSFSELISNKNATEVGSPGFTTEARVGSSAYKGADDSYLTFPTEGLLGTEFSGSFWYNLNNPGTNRAGILTISAPDPANPDNQGNRNFGFRFFREGGNDQSFRLNVGNGTGNGTAIAARRLNNDSGWVHIAFTISQTKAQIYMDGVLEIEQEITGLDWTGCDMMSIMSGAPRYLVFNHKSDLSLMDDLRLFNVVLTQSEVTNLIVQSNKIFNMPFNGNFKETVSKTDATKVGNPDFTTDAQEGTSAYKGAAESYLTFPSDKLALGNEFSTTFWLKIDASDTRAGIINIAPADPAAPSDKPSGFGLIREGSATAQRFILLVGNGTNATWVNPGAPATIDPTLGEWVHFGISISESNAALYMNGELVGQSDDFPGIDWTGVGDLSIMSGDPNFSGWDHKTEKGLMDALAIYNKALSQAEIQAIMNN